jgi:leader peptidase (prepilin peptidase)/N-methyltransferase
MLWQTLAGVALGGALGYTGGWVSPRWLQKPPQRWETYALAAVTALLAGLLAHRYGLGGYFWQHLFFIAVLTTASLIDLHDKIIPNQLVLFGLGVGAVLLFAAPYADKSWIGALGGGAAGFGALFLLAILVKGGLGFGDVKLAAVIGLFLGIQWVAMGLMLAFLAGGLIGILLLVFRIVGRKDMIPFGPYLAFGAILTSIYGQQIWDWYTRY